MPEQVPPGEEIQRRCQLAGAETYRGGRPPTACCNVYDSVLRDTNPESWLPEFNKY